MFLLVHGAVHRATQMKTPEPDKAVRLETSEAQVSNQGRAYWGHHEQETYRANGLGHFLAQWRELVWYWTHS